MHPFLDTSKLSDEELIEKLGKSYTIMNNQIALGHTPTVQSIKEVIQALEDERNSRMQKTQSTVQNKKLTNDNGCLEIGKLED